MKKFFILSLLLLPIALKAQSSENNRKGNEAMDRKDYREAMFWYEENVTANCDRHSINKLTEIWDLDESMHASMRVVMGRCLNCLNDLAINNKDTSAINLIIKYNSYGIGTDKNELAANHWKEQLEQLRNPVTDMYIPPIPRERMIFFGGYHFSPVAPFGIQAGGMGKSVGWYIRLSSNLSFQETLYDCEVVPFRDKKQLKIQQLDDKRAFYRATGNRKSTALMGSVGFMIKAIDNVYVSAGVGYWDRKYSREFIEVNNNGTDKPATSGWARDKNKSINGVTIDLSGMYIISGKFYGTVGVSSLSFKYIYPNAGVGILF